MNPNEAIKALEYIIEVADKSDCGIKEIDGIDEQAIYMSINALKHFEKLQEIKQEIKNQYRVVLKTDNSNDWWVKWNECVDECLKIIDTHISALNNDQFERIWQNTVEEMKQRKIGEYETGCTDKKCPFYLNPDYTRCKECEEKRKAGIMTPVEIARLVAGEYDKHDTEQDKVTQWINDNADFIKEMARMLEENE